MTRKIVNAEARQALYEIVVESIRKCPYYSKWKDKTSSSTEA